jgi:hypothetical protein
MLLTQNERLQLVNYAIDTLQPCSIEGILGSCEQVDLFLMWFQGACMSVLLRAQERLAIGNRFVRVN